MVRLNRIYTKAGDGGDTRLDIYDAAGRRVASLIHASLEPGNYSVTWDGRADGGDPLGAGLYFARFESPAGSSVLRFVLAR